MAGTQAAASTRRARRTNAQAGGIGRRAAAQCRPLDMRHPDDGHWRTPAHGGYAGRRTAVDDGHADTIGPRTFDRWHKGGANGLVPAVKWMRTVTRPFGMVENA